MAISSMVGRYRPPSQPDRAGRTRLMAARARRNASFRQSAVLLPRAPPPPASDVRG
eukprot:CAMPEP_0202053330 /NCGR_PEP_ID=MMETSP0963-20130614/5788_1 /ASSEMBLY_ACC=CAM_ASM_000494 /TAXON_ID=4773 /ORGANISM="Schizochytrium aggregatum, Strain ATCC28209" /LENGTH=55 /DNA_ID=CAMNT_0048618659 /DNA_START=1485 /DNA_END=1648 /DNA_ORIENTATION=+